MYKLQNINKSNTVKFYTCICPEDRTKMSHIIMFRFCVLQPAQECRHYVTNYVSSLMEIANQKIQLINTRQCNN